MLCHRVFVPLAAWLMAVIGLGGWQNNANAAIVNIDFNGVRDGDIVGPTYVGDGAAGGGTVFNGLLADSRSPNGDNLTIGGTDFLDSYGNTTSIDFTVSPVGGDVGGTATTDPSSSLALFSDYVFDHSAGNTSDSPFSIGGLDGFAVADLYFYHRSSSSRIVVDGETADTFVATGIYATSNTLYYQNVPIVDGRISGYFGGGTAIISGMTIVANVPEPGTLMLLGTALFGLTVFACRKQR